MLPNTPWAWRIFCSCLNSRLTPSAFTGFMTFLVSISWYGKLLKPRANVLEVANAEKKEVIIMGDLNCNFSPSARCRGETKKLKSILQSMNMTQVVKEPTRVTRESQTLIDIICTSQPQNITSVKVVKSALSDHDMTAFVRKLNSLKFKPRAIKCRNYSKYCATRFNEELSSVSWDNLRECQDVGNA